MLELMLPLVLPRENYFGEMIPNLLVNRSLSGCIGGDWNCNPFLHDRTLREQGFHLLHPGGPTFFPDAGSPDPAETLAHPQ